MAIKFTSVKCPECGAALPIEEGRKQMSLLLLREQNYYDK